MVNSVLIHGPVGEPNSISKINRETALALERLGYDVGVKRTDEPDDDPDMLRLGQQAQDSRFHFCWDEFSGSGKSQPVGWSCRFGNDHRSARGFLFDKFECDASWLKRVPKYDFIAAPSLHSAEWLRQGTEDREGLPNVVYAPLGVRSDIYYRDDEHEEDYGTTQKFGRELAWSENPLWLLHCGTLRMRKGTRELLEAYRLAFPTEQDVLLMIQAGDAPWPGQLFAREILTGTQAGHGGPPIRFIERTLTVAQQRFLYGLADVTVLPNYLEGFGLVALESMACGTPVVMPTHSGNLDTFSRDCCWGLREFGTELVTGVRQKCNWHPPNIDELAATLRHIYDHRDEIDQKSACCRAHALRYSWDVTAKAIADAYGLRPVRRLA